MADEHVTIARFMTTAEAAPAVARLEEEGIRVLVLGDLASNLVAGVYDPTGGVQLQVASEDVDRARMVLAVVRHEDRQDEDEGGVPHTLSGRPGWACPDCRTIVDLEMEVCPSCGRTMDLPQEGGSPTVKALATKEGAVTEEEKDKLKTWVGDKLAARALKAAVIGLFILPPLLHLYSASVLFQLRQSGSELSEDGQGKANLAWMINLIAIGLGLTLLLALLVNMVV